MMISMVVTSIVVTSITSDLREIYDELRGNKPMMSISDLNDWADVQDMLSNNIMDAGTDLDCFSFYSSKCTPPTHPK